MFIGHFGLSFAAKKAAPEVSLATLFVATQFADILWPVLVLFHVEKVAVVPGYTKMNAFDFLYYPFTHSLLMGLIWGILAAFLYTAVKKDGRGGMVVGLCVLSHWFFDVVVHTADLPFSFFGDHKAGFGLWNHVAATVVLETVIFLAGLFIYASVTKAVNKKGAWGLWALALFLFVFYLYNTFGPPPEAANESLFATLLVLMAVIVFVAGWVDKNRKVN